MLKAIRKNKDLQFLCVIILVGLILRFVGIMHGFPFIFHPDEPAVVRSATGIRFNINPGHFDWPHLHFYLNYLVHFLFIKFRGLLQVLGLQAPLAASFPILWKDPLVFYLLSRAFDALLGAFTAIPIYLAGKRLKNAKTGLLAAAVLAVFPHHVHVSHYALIDVPTAFWIAWATYFSIKIFKEFNLRDYLLAGLFIGFAASTKYNGGLAAIVVFIAHLLRVLDKKENFFSFVNIKSLVFAGLAAVFGFVLGTPFSVFDFDTFIRTDSPVGALWQFTNVGGVDFSTRLNQFFQFMTTRYLADFGYTFIIIFTLFTVYALFRMQKKYALVLIPALFLIFYTAGFAKFRIHYFMTAYPFMFLAIAIALSDFIEKKSKFIKNLLLIIVFAIPLIFSVKDSTILRRDDTRVELYNWLQQNVTILDHIVYNSSSVIPVMEKFPGDLTTKGVTVQNLKGKSGYVVIYTESLDTLENGEMPEAKVVDNLNEVLKIYSEGRQGGDIIVYAFDKTEEN